MSVTTTPALPQSGSVEIATLTSASAITSRANITGTTGLVLLTANPTNNKRIDSITVKCKGTNTAFKLFVWMYNQTTSYLWDEIDVTNTATASTTVASTVSLNRYIDTTLQTGMQLYVSQTVQNDCNVFANTANY